MKSVGFIGWRGIVGSVLLQRMIKKNDFNKIKVTFFTTSQFNKYFPLNIKNINKTLHNAYDIEQLLLLDIIITCQGSEYTNKIYYKLRQKGWQGYWLDAASNLRTDDNTIIVLDPVNLDLIKEKIDIGIKTFVGGNCTVSLMLMALGGLFKKNLIDWIFVSTYQAISGAGAKYIKELLLQTNFLHENITDIIHSNKFNILEVEKIITLLLNNKEFPQQYSTIPLVNNVIPWIDKQINNGQTKEEWKGQFETNKILNNKNIIPIDGICVRVPTLRAHSQSFMVKLNKDLSIKNIEDIIQSHNKWVKIIPNDYIYTTKYLTPCAVNRTLNIPVGRIKKLNIEKNCFSMFTVGDQLLWGAAEPLRRMLKLLI
ncbi:aspartate-semialdehyde dehydrogenase [Enterobacteriaceae endosymbiont of Neohaemonia nigricornis]|uniref:aspartate-semialdehyde dehydrogenase n=1 Tax=Enterobacteriaceae endosymbiont of Neohaemonia nigricornis TaxID=2675792 RepID=UPI0014493BC2|nr:aspartate-semialdehyde dehydrogenase [Enterobacteriaceae endosymbiont of Neohaemonia nigricornis]QJC30519.1 aspartate-semialdehyde dehydrogenase [Enterobacteriaceae endosymbiont of Neohaemonia nigricornis]